MPNAAAVDERGLEPEVALALADLEAVVKTQAEHGHRRQLGAGVEPVRVIESGYTPWWAQRMFHRPRGVEVFEPGGATARLLLRHAATFRVLVAGRQSGKTQAAAAELLRVMLDRPGSYSALLAPTYKIAAAAIRKVLELLADSFGASGWEWKEQKKELHLANGSVWAVFSADRKESVRGPTINGILWVDEGAFLHQNAWDAALGALGAVRDALVVVTTTPAGKNWVHELFTEDDPETDAFRFRSEDSPFCNVALVRRLRKKMSAEKAAQEFDAVFVDSLLLVFSDRSELWVDREALPDRTGQTLENVLGVDVAKRVDWTVLTLMNRFGEGEVLDRFQKLGYPLVVERIVAAAERHRAIVVIDVGGPGGGPGEVIADYIEADHADRVVAVERVNTGSPGTKAKLVEFAQADVQYRRMTLVRNEHTDQADYELGRFQGMRRISHGVEYTVYEGPQVDGEHDDIPISISLANAGRHLDVWKKHRDPEVQFGEFASAAEFSPGGAAESGASWGGYMF